MDHYIDITLLPNPEFKAPTLMSTLYNKLHLALVTLQNPQGETGIGVSFPESEKTVDPESKKKQQKTLGDVLRLHGNAATLQTLITQGWLTGMQDYLKITSIMPVPPDHGYVTVQRLQYKMTNARSKRLIARAAARGEAVSAQQQLAWQLQRVKRDEEEHEPFIKCKSRSSKQQFRLFIKQSLQQAGHASGYFNTYGLSKTATLPYF